MVTASKTMAKKKSAVGKKEESATVGLEAIYKKEPGLKTTLQQIEKQFGEGSIMPLGGEGAEEVVEALNRHHRFIRGRIAPDLDLKFAPDLRFFVDNTFEEFGKIDALLRSDRVQRDIHKDEDEE